MTPERYARLREALSRRQPDLTVLMERVHKSHNFSAILRSCDAAGVLEAQVVPPDGGLDLHHETAAGSSKWVDVRAHAGVDEAVAWLHQRGFTVLAAHPGEEAADFREVDLTRPVAFMLGAELHGISDEGLARADRLVVIPMAGLVRSLNVSVAAALLLFEAKRQREAAGLYDRPRLSDEEFRTRLFEWGYPEIARRHREQGLPYPTLDADGGIVASPEMDSP